jgi:NAD+ diphosphatase
MRYLYCPLCGSKLTERAAGDNGDVPYCDRCERFWFDGFSSCVIVLVHNEFGEIAMCRQSHLSLEYATVTSGYISPGENAEECAYREVKEELGLDLEDLEYVGSVWFGRKDMLMHAYLGFARKQELQLSEEIDSAAWVPYEKAPEIMFPPRPDSALWLLYRTYSERMKG